MKQVTIKVGYHDMALRDTTIGKTYTAMRYDDGEVLPTTGYVLDSEDAPAYIFTDDVGDTVETLSWMSGQYIQEV